MSINYVRDIMAEVMMAEEIASLRSGSESEYNKLLLPLFLFFLSFLVLAKSYFLF